MSVRTLLLVYTLCDPGHDAGGHLNGSRCSGAEGVFDRYSNHPIKLNLFLPWGESPKAPHTPHPKASRPRVCVHTGKRWIRGLFGRESACSHKRRSRMCWGALHVRYEGWRSVLLMPFYLATYMLSGIDCPLLLSERSNEVLWALPFAIAPGQALRCTPRVDYHAPGCRCDP